MVYAVALLAHSWLRWIVLGIALWAIVTSLRATAGWHERDGRRATALVGLADLQMLLGLLLYLGVSPIAEAAWHGGFGEPVLLVFGLLHPILMIVATIVLHVGKGRIETAPAARKHRVFAIALIAWFALVVVAIPWPGLPWGRPLARIELPPAAEAAAPAAWSRCVACHGATGHGDGPAAAGLSPRPRSFADRAWQARATNARIRAVIRSGGPAVGLSVGMPSHPDLTDADLTALVTYIRGMADTTP